MAFVEEEDTDLEVEGHCHKAESLVVVVPVAVRMFAVELASAIADYNSIVVVVVGGAVVVVAAD